MDNGKSGIMGMFGGGYGSRDPSMNVPCKYLVIQLIPIRLLPNNLVSISQVAT